MLFECTCLTFRYPIIIIIIIISSSSNRSRRSGGSISIVLSLSFECHTEEFCSHFLEMQT